MLQSCWQISSKVILLPIRCVICIFINKQVDIYSLAKLQLELFADLNLSCDVICINWDEFKTIDVFRTIDLYNYFSDIWFPSADNIIVFPRNMTIFIMIRHDGAIYYVKCD